MRRHRRSARDATPDWPRPPVAGVGASPLSIRPAARPRTRSGQAGSRLSTPRAAVLRGCQRPRCRRESVCTNTTTGPPHGAQTLTRHRPTALASSELSRRSPRPHCPTRRPSASTNRLPAAAVRFRPPGAICAAALTPSISRPDPTLGLGRVSQPTSVPASSSIPTCPRSRHGIPRTGRDVSAATWGARRRSPEVNLDTVAQAGDLLSCTRCPSRDRNLKETT